MWFKNLKIYQITQPLSIDTDTLEQQLEAQLFKPCGQQEPSRLGWVSPLGRKGNSLMHVCNGHILLCARKQERLLPANVVKEELEEKIHAIEEKEGRKIYSKERSSMRDEITFELLPRAFTRSQSIMAYIDVQRNLIMINCASASKAEEFLNLLRESIGSLPVVPFSIEQNLSTLLTDWLSNDPPMPFSIGSDCELQDGKDEKNRIRCKNQELSAEEITSHLEAGKHVIQLALQWHDRISFLLQNDLTIKRIKFEEILQEQLDNMENEDKATLFDNNFAIMSLELGAFIDDLFLKLGRKQEEKPADKNTQTAKEVA
jgi:recombination associated protein RdgC